MHNTRTDPRDKILNFLSPKTRFCPKNSVGLSSGIIIEKTFYYILLCLYCAPARIVIVWSGVGSSVLMLMTGCVAPGPELVAGVHAGRRTGAIHHGGPHCVPDQPIRRTGWLLSVADVVRLGAAVARNSALARRRHPRQPNISNNNNNMVFDS